MLLSRYAQLLPNILAKEKAYRAGAREAIMFTADGFVTEGSSSNVFTVNNGVIRTPGLEENILPGITRKVVLELSLKLGIPAKEERISVRELYAADEVFITSTTLEITLLTEVDSRAIGNGSPGPVTGALVQKYKKLTGQV